MGDPSGCNEPNMQKRKKDDARLGTPLFRSVRTRGFWTVGVEHHEISR
ncbi:MAG: hypothetical protein AAGC81_09380 [Pseudomonadota bacterium]